MYGPCSDNWSQFGQTIVARFVFVEYLFELSQRLILVGAVCAEILCKLLELFLRLI